MKQDIRISELQDLHRGWRWHSGTTIYTERFRDSRLIAASFQDTGVPYSVIDEETAVPAFDLQIDGESLAFGWEWADAAAASVETGAPSSLLRLRHTRKPVELNIETLCGGDGFFRRRMWLTNTSATATMGLTSVAPLTGAVWPMSDQLLENLHDTGGVPYRVGWMQDVNWGTEGNFQWQTIPLNTEITFGSRNGRSGFTTPFAVAHNNVYGGYLVLGLAWSANWRMSFHCEWSHGGSSKLRFALRPDGPAQMRLIAAGETVALPDVHFGMNHEGLDAAIQGWHSYLRRHVLYRVGDGVQPVIYNTGALCTRRGEKREADLIREVDIAADIGAEMLIVDAGWYTDENAGWDETAGDWVSGNRLPNDLFPVFDYARSKGLRCGLWVEPESAGRASKLANQHPDWFIQRYGHPVERILDLAKPAVRAYIEGTLLRLIERYRLDLLRLDYNVDAGEGGFNLIDGRQENTLWRHVEAIYQMFDAIRARYPALQLENCASGGGRTDLGMVSRFTTTWISDWFKMPRTVRIFNGMSMALPPEMLDRLFGVCMQGSYRGNVETQLHLIVLGHPTILGITPTLAEANPEVLRLTRKYLTIYRDFIRPFQRDARVYHHTPVIPGADGSGWCVLELAANDSSRIVAGVFRLVNAGQDEYRLCLRGVDPGRSYRVSIEPGGRARSMEGHALAEQGLTIRLDTPLTSRLVLCEVST